MNLMYFDGAPCAVKAACTVLGGGKSGDNFKGLPIAIRRQVAGYETADGRRRGRPHWNHPHSPAFRSVRLMIPMKSTPTGAVSFIRAAPMKGGN